MRNPAARLVERNHSQFDIRAWVLVTSWNPLTVWMYEPYIRICTEAHSLDPKGLGNAFQHLCNRYAEAETPSSPHLPLIPRDRGAQHALGCATAASRAARTAPSDDGRVLRHVPRRCVQKNNEAYASDDEEGGSMWSVETLTQYLDKVAPPPLVTAAKSLYINKRFRARGHTEVTRKR